MLKNLLEVPASTAEASTPVEVAAEAVQRIEKQIGETTGTRIQGLPADVYAAHPNWTEDFLTVNEYSRPGDPLTEVKIFCTLHGESWDQRGPEPQLLRTAERQS